MSISRPFAYNPGSILSGTTQYGTLAVGIDLTLPYASNYGGIQWWNGPDEELGFCIGTSNPSSDQPTPIGNNGNVGFWRTNGFDDQEFIALANTLTQQNFTNGNEAKLWLNNNGYWTSYDSSVVTPTPTPSITPTITPTVTETPTNTPTPTVTPTETTTPTPTKSIAVTPTPTNALTPSCVNVLSYKQIGNGFSVNDPGYMQLPSGTPFSSATIEYRFNNIDSNGTNAWNIFGNLLSGDTILVESNDFGYNYISYQVVTPPVWNGLHWFIGQVSVLETNTNSRAVFTISSNVTFTINSLCVSPTPSVTPTITPTSSDVPVTPTPTPSTSPVPVTGYGYDLVVLPYNPPASGNTIFPTFASPGLNSGTTNPNTFTTNGVYWNPIDNLGVDRTNYYSGMTGVSVTAYFTQNGDTAIYSGTTTAFTIEGPPGQESFNYNPQARPGQLTLIQSASSDFVTGQTVNISYIVN